MAAAGSRLQTCFRVRWLDTSAAKVEIGAIETFVVVITIKGARDDTLKEQNHVAEARE